MRVVLAGNPNSGKTTLFNALTGSRARVGNWHGVTVTAERASAKINGESVEFIDVPGLISTSVTSPEEKVSADIILGGDYDVIVCVIEASQLSGAARLADEILAVNKPAVLFVNFYGELKKIGGSVNKAALEKISGVEAVVGEAVNKKDVEKLRNAIFAARAPVGAITDRSGLGAPRGKLSGKINEFFKEGKLKLSKADEVFLNAKTAIPIYVLSLAAAFYLAFGKYGLGKILGDLIAYGVELAAMGADILLLRLGVNEFISGIVTEGMILGVGTVLAFVPQIAVLQLCLIILEQSGVIARISFLTDGFLSRFGLSGRAVYTLLMGFGCTTVALTTSGAIENSAMKKRLAASLPFVSCSARTPVYLFFASVAFKNAAALALFAVYAASIVLTLAAMAIVAAFDKSDTVPMILEIPRIRKIRPGEALKLLIKSVKEFIIKLTTVVMLVSAAVFILKSVSVRGELMNGDVSTSLLAWLGGKLSFLFKPLDIDGWEIPSAMLTGIFAKEAIISTLALACPNGLILTAAQGAALIAFTLVYTPCVVALSAMRREAGLAFTLQSALFQLVFALLLSYYIYYLFISRIVTIISLAVIVIVVAAAFAVRAIKRKNREGVYRSFR